MENRLFGTLELRSVNDDLREFEGIASTASLDDHGTIIEPAGARFNLPLPLLWFHDQKTPVGEITHAENRNGQLFVRGTIRTVTEPGKVRDATDEAWHSLKYKLVRGLSVGFHLLKQKGNRIIEWALREISLVSIPSNQEASITSVRSAYLAASGDPKHPGVSGQSTTTTTTTTTPRHGKMTIQEQITQFENTRAAKVARRDSLLEKSGAEGTTLDESESETFDTLDTEIRSIDAHLTRLNSARADIEKRAVAVSSAPSIMKASENRGGVSVVRTSPNTIPGIGFARYVMALAATRGNRYEAAHYAKETWGESADEVVAKLQTRAAVAPGTTVQATFAAPLVPTNFLNEFLELLRPATLIGRIPGLRRVPFNISMPSQTAGGTYKWVGEGKAKPVTNAQFATVTLGMAKASGIIVLTEELVRSSAPSAQEVVRDELRNGIVQFLDTQFVDPAVAAVANVNPASITNGVAGTAASGTTEAAARADIKALLSGFVTSNLGLGGVVLLMNEAVAFKLAATVNSVGELAFPGMSATGGNLLGIPVITSNVITAAIGIIAVHAPSILLADEGGVEIDVSREASLQMDSAPTEPPDLNTVFTSLWQMNLVGLRAERFINWGKARTGAVDRIHTVAYV